MKKNKLWRVLSLGLVLVMMLSLLAACQSEEDKPVETKPPSISFEPEKLDETADVTIVYNPATEEETSDTSAGTKTVNKDHGYVIYLLDGFTYTPGNAVDTIESADKTLKMTIRQVTKDVPTAESGYDEATDAITAVERKLYEDKDRLVEFVFTFPLAELEGRARLLYAMKDSLRNGN